MRRRGPGPARVSGAALGDGCALIGGWLGGLGVGAGLPGSARRLWLALVS